MAAVAQEIGGHLYLTVTTELTDYNLVQDVSHHLEGREQVRGISSEPLRLFTIKYY